MPRSPPPSVLFRADDKVYRATEGAGFGFFDNKPDLTGQAAVRRLVAYIMDECMYQEKAKGQNRHIDYFPQESALHAELQTLVPGHSVQESSRYEVVHHDFGGQSCDSTVRQPGSMTEPGRANWKRRRGRRMMRGILDQ